jgi:hypothetical protein
MTQRAILRAPLTQDQLDRRAFPVFATLEEFETVYYHQ